METMTTWRERLWIIIFGSDTVAGKTFDVLLILSIVISVLVVMLDSVKEISEVHGSLLYGLEWFFTLLFSAEYVLRLLTSNRPSRYATSFFGIIDLLAILPTYVSIFFPGSQVLIVIRILRVLRVFRILKFAQYIRESSLLMRALYASRRKIIVFLFAVLTIIVIMGSLMYLIEGEEHGFTSIPRSVYWAIVTLTTVGYGDILPQTTLGQALAALIMITGYAIIAVPTGIISAEIAHQTVDGKKDDGRRECRECGEAGHDNDARFCKFCSHDLDFFEDDAY